MALMKMPCAVGSGGSDNYDTVSFTQQASKVEFTGLKGKPKAVWITFVNGSDVMLYTNVNPTTGELEDTVNYCRDNAGTISSWTTLSSTYAWDIGNDYVKISPSPSSTTKYGTLGYTY